MIPILWVLVNVEILQHEDIVKLRGLRRENRGFCENNVICWSKALEPDPNMGQTQASYKRRGTQEEKKYLIR